MTYTTNTSKNWFIDGNIDLSEIAVESEFHRWTMVDRLTCCGISRSDAEAFAEFMYHWYGHPDELTDDQRDRLILKDNGIA